MPMLENLDHWFKTWSLTTILAVWGAVVSTATAIWSIRKDLRDKVKVKVTASLRCIGFREGDGQPYMANPGMNIAGMSDRLYVVVSVANVGRRRVRWTGWGGKYKKPVNGKDGFTLKAADEAPNNEISIYGQENDLSHLGAGPHEHDSARPCDG
jgi:hypothetical protein